MSFSSAFGMKPQLDRLRETFVAKTLHKLVSIVLILNAEKKNFLVTEGVSLFQRKLNSFSFSIDLNSVIRKHQALANYEPTPATPFVQKDVHVRNRPYKPWKIKQK